MQKTWFQEKKADYIKENNISHLASVVSELFLYNFCSSKSLLCHSRSDFRFFTRSTDELSWFSWDELYTHRKITDIYLHHRFVEIFLVHVCSLLLALAICMYFLSVLVVNLLFFPHFSTVEFSYSLLESKDLSILHTNDAKFFAFFSDFALCIVIFLGWDTLLQLVFS